jgi:hypothetical protein
LPLRPATNNPQPDALVAASLPATPRHLPPSAGRRRQARQAQVQILSDRLLRYFHLDIAEVHTEEGRLYLLVAIDRTSKFAYVELHEKATTRIAADFLRALLKAVPYKVHTILTDNGTHFTTPGNKSSAAPDIKRALETGEPFRGRAGSRLPLGVPATIMFFASGAL